MLALIISTALLPFYAFLQWTGFWSRIPKYREVLGSYARPWLELARPAALAGLTAFGVTTIIAKVFAIFTSVFRYGRSISLANLLAAPAESVAVVLFAAIAVAVAITADRFCAGYKRAARLARCWQDFSLSLRSRWSDWRCSKFFVAMSSGKWGSILMEAL